MSGHTITHVIMMGDSLSDRGTMYHRHLCGCIPMRSLSGLQGRSPQGRFTNGLAWTDHLSVEIANELLIKALEDKDHKSAIDISDAIIAKNPKVEKLVQHAYYLDNDLFVRYKGQNFIRNYDEGGLTAHDYSWQPSTSISRFFSRLILSTLGKKRQKLLAYDRLYKISTERKPQTLIIEWSGANDLITVNKRPSRKEVDLAIKARIKNVDALIKNGYRHFVLFNLPDLSLTPRYQSKSTQERDNAKVWSDYFNEQLVQKCQALQTKHPDCTIEIFDVATIFADIYNNPEQHGFEKEKLTQPYTTSKDFHIENNHTSAIDGYMFWDDVHPTTDVHAKLASRFYTTYSLKYQLQPPNSQSEQELNLIKQFVNQYKTRFARDREAFFGCLRRSRIHYNHELNLDRIITHALQEGGNRTRDVIVELGWIDRNGNATATTPQAIKEIIDPPTQATPDCMHLRHLPF